MSSTSQMSGLLTGRTAIVTGAAKGIGLAIARAFHAAGANVLLADKDIGAQATADELGERAAFQHCDVSIESQVSALTNAALDHFGQLDVMVNNAGIGSDYDDPTQIEEAAMDRLHAVNQKGVMFGIKHAALAMSKSGGSIINMASIAALSGGTSGFIYSGTKGAVTALTRSAALHLGDRNIRVNALAPGIVLTPIYEESYPVGVARKVLEHQASTQQPIRHLGQPEDICGPSLFLASDLSAFVTGQVIAVDGGYSTSHRGALEAGFAKLQDVMSNL